VLALADVLDLLANELACLSRGRFSFFGILPGPSQGVFIWHLKLPPGVMRICLIGWVLKSGHAGWLRKERTCEFSHSAFGSMMMAHRLHDIRSDLLGELRWKTI